jgi:hypothetical protein
MIRSQIYISKSQATLDQDSRRPVPPKKRAWKREDLYEEQMSRYDH